MMKSLLAWTLSMPALLTLLWLIVLTLGVHNDIKDYEINCQGTQVTVPK